MIYVYAKYQKPTPYIKRDIANVKVFTTPAGRRPAGRTDGRTAGRNRHYIDSHCIACESNMGISCHVSTMRGAVSISFSIEV